MYNTIELFFPSNIGRKLLIYIHVILPRKKLLVKFLLLRLINTFKASEKKVILEMFTKTIHNLTCNKKLDTF